MVLVEMLMALVKKATAGELRAAAIAWVDGGDTINTEWDFGTVPHALLVAGVARMQGQVLQAWDES